jgi:hypothetical protein
MKTYTELDVFIHIFLTSALVVGEWPVRRPCRFTSCMYCIRSWMGPRADLEGVDKRKFLILPGLQFRLLCRPASSQSLHRLLAINEHYKQHAYGNETFFIWWTKLKNVLQKSISKLKNISKSNLWESVADIWKWLNTLNVRSCGRLMWRGVEYSGSIKAVNKFDQLNILCDSSREKLNRVAVRPELRENSAHPNTVIVASNTVRGMDVNWRVSVCSV